MKLQDGKLLLTASGQIACNCCDDCIDDAFDYRILTPCPGQVFYHACDETETEVKVPCIIARTDKLHPSISTDDVVNIGDICYIVGPIASKCDVLAGDCNGVAYKVPLYEEVDETAIVEGGCIAAVCDGGPVVVYPVSCNGGILNDDPVCLNVPGCLVFNFGDGPNPVCALVGPRAKWGRITPPFTGVNISTLLGIGGATTCCGCGAQAVEPDGDTRTCAGRTVGTGEIVDQTCCCGPRHVGDGSPGRLQNWFPDCTVSVVQIKTVTANDGMGNVTINTATSTLTGTMGISRPDGTAPATRVNTVLTTVNGVVTEDTSTTNAAVADCEEIPGGALEEFYYAETMKSGNCGSISASYDQTTSDGSGGTLRVQYTLSATVSCSGAAPCAGGCEDGFGPSDGNQDPFDLIP